MHLPDSSVFCYDLRMPTILSQKDLYTSRLFIVREVALRFANGNEANFEIIIKKNSAMIVPVTDDGDLVLIRDYFAGTHELKLSLPKGRIDPGEDPLETGNRELQEEIGYKAESMELLTVVTTTPNYLSQRTYIYLARGLKESKLDGDEIQGIEVVRHPFADFEALIDSGELNDSRMIAGLYLARRAMNQS